MIIILDPLVTEGSSQFKAVIETIKQIPDVSFDVHTIQGEYTTLTEIYLLGDTRLISEETFKAIPGVMKVISLVETTTQYPIKHQRHQGFTYNGVTFNQDTFHLFAGLCAVDTKAHVIQTFQAISQLGLTCTRMGAYKPRTSPYTFQGHGDRCLPWVFELAGHYGVRVIAMEVTHESQIESIHQALEKTGFATGVMLQIGTRNAQNFELLKAVGRQQTYPVLVKRGFGISLQESLSATEYISSEGNSNLIFCLRGMKTHFSAPHRNLVDFAHIPVVKRQTGMPICIDPSHSVGSRASAPDGLMDIFHATSQGIIAGANMALVDVHPHRKCAFVDGKQALTLEELPWLVEDIDIAREAYLKRIKLAKSQHKKHQLKARKEIFSSA